jgi:hypothetical protein
VLPDYYAVLQVHPDADFEVIEAAYRQLMKKHHPDMAGEDPQRIAAHEARAKAINEAFRILRDPAERRRYDYARIYTGTVRPGAPPPSRGAASRPGAPPPSNAAGRPTPPPPHATGRGSATPPPPAAAAPSADTAASSPPSSDPTDAVAPPPTPQRSSWLLAPFTLLSAAYYLLPGPYEWEPGGGRELITVLLLPILGIVAFALASGRLSPLIGHSLPATMLAWALLALAVMLSMWSSLPRVALAVLPSVALLTGWLTPMLQQAHVPVLIAWGLLSSLSLIFAARFYVFGVLPTLGIIWLVASFS